jgi:hypothetical protein
VRWREEIEERPVVKTYFVSVFIRTSMYKRKRAEGRDSVAVRDYPDCNKHSY